jgi:hypothetical protein
MYMNFIKIMLTAIVLFAVSFAVNAEVSSGTVTVLRTTMDGQKTLYFKMNPMPAGVTQWLYVREGTENAAGCQLITDDTMLQLAYSTLLAAKAAALRITVGYCADSNGYGLVNQYIELD